MATEEREQVGNRMADRLREEGTTVEVEDAAGRKERLQLRLEAAYKAWRQLPFSTSIAREVAELKAVLRNERDDA
jgi:predicted nucleic acid-binding protein